LNTQNTNYWKENLKYVGILLSIWFLVSFCFSILFKEFLDSFYLGGFKLGFWFAQRISFFYKTNVGAHILVLDMKNLILILLSFQFSLYAQNDILNNKIDSIISS